jgi:hypothetical protein
MKQTYAEKLKDPRWQKRRLEILTRDNWTCQDCGSKDKTLHVHHWMYVHGLDPWSYADQLLITLCHDCHQLHRESSSVMLYRLVALCDSLPIEIWSVSRALQRALGDDYLRRHFVAALCALATDRDAVTKLADATYEKIGLVSIAEQESAAK